MYFLRALVVLLCLVREPLRRKSSLYHKRIMTYSVMLQLFLQNITLLSLINTHFQIHSQKQLTASTSQKVAHKQTNMLRITIATEPSR